MGKNFPGYRGDCPLRRRSFSPSLPLIQSLRMRDDKWLTGTQHRDLLLLHTFLSLLDGEMFRKRTRSNQFPFRTLQDSTLEINLSTGGFVWLLNGNPPRKFYWIESFQVSTRSRHYSVIFFLLAVFFLFLLFLYIFMFSASLFFGGRYYISCSFVVILFHYRFLATPRFISYLSSGWQLKRAAPRCLAFFAPIFFISNRKIAGKGWNCISGAGYGWS